MLDKALKLIAQFPADMGVQRIGAHCPLYFVAKAAGMKEPDDSSVAYELVQEVLGGENVADYVWMEWDDDMSSDGFNWTARADVPVEVQKMYAQLLLLAAFDPGEVPIGR